MLKKYYLAFLLLIHSCLVYGSSWDEITQCLSDPCNCGYSTINEIWNGKIIRTIKPDPVCPPWNRRDGRDTDNCLLQFSPPEKWNGFYLQHCAESTLDSSYFAPKIRIRTQSCNAFSCWSQSTTLNWDGECVVWPGAYGLPLTRICARIAVPAIVPTDLNVSGTPADPGYTLGKHLNNVGFAEDDLTFVGDDGKQVIFDSPKLCAYSDPGLVNLISDTGGHLDPMDWNATKQPLHQTNKLHPLVKVLIFLIDTAQSLSIPQILEKLLNQINADEIPGLNVLQSIIEGIGKIAELFSSILKSTLETLGSLNIAVDDYKFGCVQLPLGPFPPPYCPKLAQFITSPKTQSICYKKKDGIFVQSSNEPCVVSKLNNNIVNNVIRISLDNLVPLCKNGQNPQETDKCVVLQNLGLFSSAKAIHIATAQRDAIKKCSNSSDTNVCVNTKIKFTCNVVQNGCEDGFRIVYAQKIGDHSTPSGYYVDDLPDCGSSDANNTTTCQEIWGINSGEFIDIAVAFPKIQSQEISDLSMLTTKFTLKDNNGTERPFVAAITRSTFLDNSLTEPFIREPKDICITEGSELIGCEKRVSSGYEILTYNCGGISSIICPNDSYYTPQFIASMRAINGNDSTSSVVTPLSISSNPKPSVNEVESLINLAGYDFTSFMADISTDTYNAIPFFGVNAINPLTSYGQYKDGKKPYDAITGKPIDNAVYLKGIEYINGKYIQGASHGCLQLKNIDKCVPTINNSNCVLAKLLENDTVDCEIFKSKSAEPQYQNLRLCQANDTNCSLVDSIPGLERVNSGITIYKCGTSKSIICYKNNNKADTEVCSISQNTENRVDPSPFLGPIINKTDQHYIVNTGSDGSFGYDQKLYAIRDKTSQELGFCTSIPVPKCSAITIPTSDTGNATWSETAIGELSQGTCKQGWVAIDPNKPLERYCLSNIKNKVIEFEPLASDVGCKKNQGLSFKYSTNLPIYIPDNDIPHTENYDSTTKIGTFALGDGIQKLSDTLRCSYYELEIPNTDSLESFTIGGDNSYFEDYLVIKVNAEYVYAEPDKAFPAGRVKDMRCFKSTRVENCRLVTADELKFLPNQYTNTIMKEFSLMRYLKNGTNTISICVGVVGEGDLKFNMKYKMK